MVKLPRSGVEVGVLIGTEGQEPAPMVYEVYHVCVSEGVRGHLTGAYSQNLFNVQRVCIGEHIQLYVCNSTRTPKFPST